VEKARWRRTVLARRAQLTETAREAAGAALTAAVLPLADAVDVVAAYVSVGTEPPTRALIDALAGRTVLVPVLLPDGDVDWAAWDGTAHAAARGLLEPAGPRLGVDAVARCGLVVVPALAVDRRGVRLGRGGGSYDRALGRARATVVALLHDGELVEALPQGPHDVPVDVAVTPSEGVVRVGAG
jgi:5-formyltetrahydrofolate cyclo-ligase